MVAKKPRIVIIGAGMAGITAANKLYTNPFFKDLFDLHVFEGGTRIGGRINTSEFGGDRIEMGATWIHGIGGSPIHKIAQETHSLNSDQPWECMDGFLDEPLTVAEGGFELNPSLVEPILGLFNNLMDIAQGKVVSDGAVINNDTCTINGGSEGLERSSLGCFLRQGLEKYWCSTKSQGEVEGYGDWRRESIEDAVFAMNENTQRTFTSAGDLLELDYSAESEYRMFPGEEITIAKGYLSIIEALASVLPAGLIQLGRKVREIEWQPDGHQVFGMDNNGGGIRPVKLHFHDGSTMEADHVIVTVSLGVLKRGIRGDSSLFNPPLPGFKTQAISRLGYGVVNKLFVQLSPPCNDREDDNLNKFPFLQMVFHQSDSKLRHPEIPWWMRRTASLCPIYSKSSVLLSWFAGKEALELESLEDEEILEAVSTTISSFLPNCICQKKSSYQELCNGNVKSVEGCNGRELKKFTKVLKSQWGSDPLFFGSYSYVAVGSSGDDLDTMAEPLPQNSNQGYNSSPKLQILFAGEATHRIHYSTTHGAYFSGLREANRLLKHYKCSDV